MRGFVSLRIVFIVFMSATGLIMMLTGFLQALVRIWEAIQQSGQDSTDNLWFHGTHLNFANFATGPFVAAVILFSAFAAWKNQWKFVRAACWFFAAGFVGIIAMTWHYGLADLFSIRFFIFQLAPLLFPVLVGLWLSAIANPNAYSATGYLDYNAGWQRKFSPIVALATVASAVYAWRIIAASQDPLFQWALEARPRGTFSLDGNELVLASASGTLAAIFLLAALVLFLTGRTRIMVPALAFAAGVSCLGFFEAIDFAVGIGGGRWPLWGLSGKSPDRISGCIRVPRLLYSSGVVIAPGKYRSTIIKQFS